MPVRYKIDVLEALKAKGYTTYKGRSEKLLSESTVQKLYERVMVDNISFVIYNRDGEMAHTVL